MWLRDISPIERRSLLAGCLGYGVDAFDFMAYTFVIPTLLVDWSMSRSQAGSVATGALLSSAVGGWLPEFLPIGMDAFAYCNLRYCGFRCLLS